MNRYIKKCRSLLNFYVIRLLVVFSSLFFSATSLSFDCYDNEVLVKVNCFLDIECMDTQAVYDIYNLVAMSEGYYLAGLEYNTLKEIVDSDYRALKENFSTIDVVKSIRYRCVWRGGKDFLIVGLDKIGNQIVLDYIFRDGGVVTGGKVNNKDLPRYFDMHSWTTITR